MNRTNNTKKKNLLKIIIKKLLKNTKKFSHKKNSIYFKSTNKLL